MTYVNIYYTKCTGVLLATARVNALGPNGTKIQVRALIDPGSQISLVTQAMCNLLSLNCRTSHTHIQGICEKTADVSSKVSRLTYNRILILHSHWKLMALFCQNSLLISPLKRAAASRSHVSRTVTHRYSSRY